MRAAQDAWQRVGYVPDSVAAPLAARFQRAVQRFYGEKKPGAPRGAGAARTEVGGAGSGAFAPKATSRFRLGGSAIAAFT